MEVIFENIVAEHPPALATPTAPPSFALVEEPLFFALPEAVVKLLTTTTPVLIAILIPFLILGRWGIQTFLFLRVLFRKLGQIFKAALLRWWMETFEDPKIPRNHKCPACGHRHEHKIYYMREYKTVMHQCSICSAVFATPTVIDVARWDVVPIQEAENQSKAPWMT